MSCEGYFQLWHLVSMTPFVRQNPISHVEVDYPLSSSVDLVKLEQFLVFGLIFSEVEAKHVR